jgi:hypothetical protein
MGFNQCCKGGGILGILTFLAACAAPSAKPPAAAQQQPAAATAPASTAWVAPPSADLPKGFPAPGPVGQVMLKDYPAYRAAMTSAPAGSGGGRSSLFYPLFNHIQRNHIPMSAPVEMEFTAATTEPAYAPEPTSMAFIYGDPAMGKLGPDGPVTVVDVPAMKVVSVGVQGSYTVKRFATATERLKTWLAAHNPELKTCGEPRYLGYNSPFVLPFMRYGEVQIPVCAAH